MTPAADGEGAGPAGWGVVVPVKRLDVAKSRLAPVGDRGRRALALAFAEDVVLACLASAVVCRVVVVTDDGPAAEALSALGAQVTPDLPRRGLDAALVHGARVLRADQPGLGVAAVAADLPALRPEDLTAVLSAVRGRAVVADAAGRGTTLLAAGPGRELQPAFGGSSLRRHLGAGAVLVEAPAGVRRDVDTPADLEAALRLGVGPRTASAAGLALPQARRGCPPAAQGTMLP
ncbi:MAG TPA: 2-phospho-L-lactate guanylyltransferase [Mycobacteriales bacterium]|nr:2-phospho-L-lactate guanylyltransferase [Mycobacteriales bacterium]